MALQAPRIETALIPNAPLTSFDAVMIADNHDRFAVQNRQIARLERPRHLLFVTRKDAEIDVQRTAEHGRSDADGISVTACIFGQESPHHVAERKPMHICSGFAERMQIAVHPQIDALGKKRIVRALNGRFHVITLEVM